MSVLIIYSTKYGFTNQCVDVLASKLYDQDIKKINLRVNKVPNLSSYDKIIVGGSIYIGMLRKDIKKFCAENKTILMDKKVGLFITCSSMGEEAKKQIQMNFDENLYNHATVTDYFGGKMNMEKAKFFDRMIIKMVTKADKGKSERSNGLDTERIVQFAEKMNDI